MRWYWWAVVIWIVGPMVLLPTWYVLRRLLPIPDAERVASDEGELRALRAWRRAGSPRKFVLNDPGPAGTKGSIGDDPAEHRQPPA